VKHRCSHHVQILNWISNSESEHDDYMEER